MGDSSRLYRWGRIQKEGAFRMQESSGNVTPALEMAGDELAVLVQSLRDQGAEAFRSGDEAGFAKISERLQAVEDFQKRFAQLQQEWTALNSRRRAPRTGRRRTARPRASRGELLPARAYAFPILQTLKDAGGSASVREVLAGVHSAVGHRLTQRDREALANGQVRWENRTQWARMDLVRAGYLAPSRRKGVWEITPAGLRELEANDLDATWAKVMAAARRRERQP